MGGKLKVGYLSHRNCIPFALESVIMPDTDFTYVHSGHLEYRIDGGECFSVRAGEALFVPVGHRRERLEGTENAVYTSIILKCTDECSIDLPVHLPGAGTYDVTYCIDRLTEIYSSPTPFAEELADGLLRYLLHTLAALHIQSKQNRYVYDMQKYILRSYAERITLEDVAAVAHISKSYASAVFRKETGRSIGAYVADVRLEEAAKRLQYTNESVSDIAEKTGFCDLFYFSRVFKRFKGLSPKEYRAARRSCGGGPPVVLQIE